MTRCKICGTFTGENHSCDKTKQNQSKAQKKLWENEEHREHMSQVHKGQIVTKETRRKLSIAHSNPSRETREKMSLAHKGKNHWNFGKHHSEETKRKLSEVLKGKIISKETRRKMSKSRLGNKHPNWQGGISFEPYDKNWTNKFKRAIRKRDNQVCVLCGIHREKLNEALTIHHANYDKKLTIPQNCLSLCRSCNSKVNFNRKHWIKFFQSLLTEKYGYQYNNQEIIVNMEKTL